MFYYDYDSILIDEDITTDITELFYRNFRSKLIKILDF